MNWWQYLLLANVYLVLFYGFYALMLRRETFFQLNRVYLVSSAVLSFMIPLIQAEWARNLFITQRINQTIYQLDTVNIYSVEIPLQKDSGITLGQGLAIIYVAGIIILFGKFLVQLLLLRRNLESNEPGEAYSFFKQIKLSDKLTSRGVIMAHEQVHARQWHSADVLLIEAVMIINWFNPVVYFYRKAIKHIHEFIADRDALKAGTGKQEYALLLLSETFKTPAHQLVNSFFNHSLLKQRIIMLQKDHSRRTALIKYGLSAPLFALMIILSSATAKTNKVISNFNNKANEVMLLQAAPVVTDVLLDPTKAGAASAVKEFQPQTPPPAPAQGMFQRNKNPDFYTSVDNSAEFPGGMDAFGKYLVKNIRMTPAIKATLPQKAVIVQFIVEKDGSLTGIHTLRGSGPTAAEAIRVISISPKWKPGSQDGKIVRQQYNVPIKFTLQDQERVGTVVKGGADKPLFTSVEQSAEFPGGLGAFGKFLAKNIMITPAIKAQMPLPRIICQFVVEEDGELSDIKIIRGSNVPAADNEALRVLKISPKWKPGMQNGRTVRQQYTVPISFGAPAPQRVGMSAGKNSTLSLINVRADTVKGHVIIFNKRTDDFDKAVYLVDGKQVDNGLKGVSPNEIRSISVFRSKFSSMESSRDTIKIELKEKN